MLIKQETLFGRGTWVENWRERAPRKPALLLLPALRFYGNRIIIPRLSVANYSDSGSFLVAHRLFSQDEFHKRG